MTRQKPLLRPGNRNPQNIYRVDPDGTETFIAVAMSPDLAAWLVDTVNAAAHENRGSEIHGEPRTDPTPTRDTRPAP